MANLQKECCLIRSDTVLSHNFARALLTAERVLNETDYVKLRRQRYTSFDSGKGADFEKGKLKLEDLHDFAAKNGEPKKTSGKQALFESFINQVL